MRRNNPGAFALLMTLVLVVMVGVSLVAIARWSLLAGADARDAGDELQRRWAVACLQRALLPRADVLLCAEEKRRRGRGVAEVRFTIHLNDAEYEVVVTDEQSKLNVNRLLEKESAAEVERRVRPLVRGALSGAEGLRLHLRPVVAQRAAAVSAALPVIGSYGQIFDAATPGELLGDGRNGGGSSLLTCWGDGRVNVRRAAAAVLENACAGILAHEEIAVLIKAREGAPALPVAALLARQAGLDERERTQLEQRLTDESTCFGVWIVARTERRSYYHLAVGEMTRPAGLPDGTITLPTVSRRHDVEW